MVEEIEKILNSKKLNYKTLLYILKPYLNTKNIGNFNVVNIYIDFNSIVKSLYNPDTINYFNSLKNNDKYVISSLILNMIGHYRHFFASRLKCYTTFYFLYNSLEDKRLLKINKDYNKDYYEKRFDLNHQIFGVLNTIMKENIKVIKTFIKYVPNAHFIDSNDIDLRGSFDIIRNNYTEEGNLNLILSNDDLFYQELIYDDTLILELRGNEKSRIISSENVFETIKRDTKSKALEDESIILFPESLSILQSLTSHKNHNIKGIKRYGYATGIKFIQKILNKKNINIEEEYNNPNDLKELFDGYLSDEEIKDLINNFLIVNNHIISNSSDKLIDLIDIQCIDKNDNGSVKKTNEKFFERFPLLIDFMWEGEE